LFWKTPRWQLLLWSNVTRFDDGELRLNLPVFWTVFIARCSERNAVTVLSCLNLSVVLREQNPDPAQGKGQGRVVKTLMD
jgi:hypothetical protein